MEAAHEYRPQLNPKFLAAVRAKQEEQAKQARIAEARRKTRQKFQVVQRPIINPEQDYRVHEIRKIPGTLPIIKHIIIETAAEFGVTYDDIIGASRFKNIVKARHTCMRRAVEARPDLGLPAIGKIFKRDHTTILAALRKTKQPGQVR